MIWGKAEILQIGYIQKSTKYKNLTSILEYPVYQIYHEKNKKAQHILKTIFLVIYK